MTVEQQRRRIVRRFVLANVVQDTALLGTNIFTGVAKLCGHISSGLSNYAQTAAFVKYDAARQYKDLTGGDFGTVIGCPGHFTGECVHATSDSEVDDDD